MVRRKEESEQGKETRESENGTLAKSSMEQRSELHENSGRVVLGQACTWRVKA